MAVVLDNHEYCTISIIFKNVLGQHAQTAGDTSSITSGDDRWGLVADTELEAC